jgi:hypothetical protein
LDEVIDITDVWNIMDSDLLISKQGGADDLQRFILRTLWRNGTTQQVSAFYLE